MLDSIGLGMPLPLVTIALPVGVSFFTFQAITYVVDVKRRQVEPASTARRRDLPQLLPPPGRRADRPGQRVPAAAEEAARPRPRRGRRRAHPDRARPDQEGDDRRLPGAGRSSTRSSACPQAYGAPDVILAAYAYAAQIYCDFSGYTDMAIGLALLMGFIFPQNFNSPYRATGLPRLLAPLAHDPLALPPRLPLHPARRQPQGPGAHLPQPDDHDDRSAGSGTAPPGPSSLWGAFQGTGLSAEHALNGRLGRISPAGCAGSSPST